ncbi:DUF2301 domain-containing membrane protein [Oscillatoria sp. FACHB-1407]|uniref:DUF2301 domain-containing membrane protein n=1 Tax=Oscillatoria sp. FACHB-1407 TaxID=2692847 RepID=UPI0016886FA7|nr:DUF2301 domain-containing membrane protein [Oscillatoria sp. FACHB-1407]MBD2461776.1 DUF2301 domain-containing membrane protein [Oscillatoria sp. FACHB-1407]
MTAQANASPSDAPSSEVYQGQFGEFTITTDDRKGVVVYRAGLAVAAVSFAIGVGLVLWQGDRAIAMSLLTLLFGLFSAGLGVSLLTIHIYLLPLHRALQAFWAVGTVSAIALAFANSQPLALTVYQQPLTLFGIGFTFAALTGIFFKEAFCFNRLETKLLTPLVPLLLLGHLTGILSADFERVLLATWAALFLVFAIRKIIQPIPPDIGDKSVFAYLKQQRTQQVS